MFVNQEQYEWWFSQSSKSFDAHEDSSCDLGFGESVRVVEEALEKGVDGAPFDGVLAFSQGAALAAHLCVLQETGKLNSSFKYELYSTIQAFRCIVQCSGSVFWWLALFLALFSIGRSFRPCSTPATVSPSPPCKCLVTRTRSLRRR